MVVTSPNAVACTMLLMSCCERRSSAASSRVRCSLLATMPVVCWSTRVAVPGDTRGLGSSVRWRAVRSWADGPLLGELAHMDAGEQLDWGDSLDALTDIVYRCMGQE